MQHSASLRQFFFDRLRRCLLASAGLALFAVGFYLQLVANVGLSPWHALNDGLTHHLPITFGQASILVSVIIIVSDLLMKEAIGLGTILDAFLVGWCVDFFLWLDLIPYQAHFLPGMALLLVGIVITCVGQYVYMIAGLSCGPRDAFLVAIGKRVPKVPIGRVNIVLMLCVLAIGFALGGSMGIGTVVCLFGTGFIMDVVFKILKFEPRNVEHENLLQTIAAFRRACGSSRAEK